MILVRIYRGRVLRLGGERQGGAVLESGGAMVSRSLLLLWCGTGSKELCDCVGGGAAGR